MAKAILTIEDEGPCGEVTITLEFEPILEDESNACHLGMYALRKLVELRNNEEPD